MIAKSAFPAFNPRLQSQSWHNTHLACSNAYKDCPAFLISSTSISIFLVAKDKKELSFTPHI